MSQNDLSIANQGFASFRSDLNSALQALGSTNSGTSAPSTTYANQLFYDTTNNILKIRNEDNDAFINLITLDQTNDKAQFDLDGTELILDADGDTSITADTDDQIDFKTGGTDRVIIDSSGNTFVSKNSASRTTVGHEFKADGFARHTVSGDKVLEIVRTSSDGEILEFFKDSTLVGELGSEGGNSLYILSGDTGLRFSDSANKIIPVTTSGSARDNAITLGSSGARFADLFIGGGIYLGGTGSSNELDDYEEGTWTPDLIIDSSNSGITYSTRSAEYIKIGKLVFVNGDVQLTNKGSTSGIVEITGLPFTVDDRTGGTSLDGGSSLVAFSTGTLTIHTPIGLVGKGGSTDITLKVRSSGSATMATALSNTHINDGFSARFSLTYTTT